MNASYDWLRALVPFDETPAQLRDLITSRTATVDELAPLREDLEPIVIARVVESEKIPETRLSFNKVDAGTGELLEVVCGAPNVEVGALYPFAPSGTTMPNGMKIERRRIRGFTSNGMLCSARELNLGDDQDGILTLHVDAAPGTPFLRAFPAGDMRLVVDVLPNRPDLLSHHGLARELAAITGKPLALPAFAGDSLDVPAAKRVRRAGRTDSIAVHLEDAALATRYMGAVVRGVTVGPSPEWLVQRLASVGVRSINNVVDATNYVLHELGQPVHAFDVSTLDQGTIVIRSAKDGERITTLDGTDRALASTMTVIADAVRPVAIAGIMGGRDSEVSDRTTDVFLEVAIFDPARTRAARRALGLSTDASYRFERGVDPALPPLALERLVRLVMAVAGGALAGEPVDVYAGDPPPATLPLRVARVERLLGEPVPAAQVSALLRGVGFGADVEGGDEIVRVVVPSWRRDVAIEADLIEEVARLRGYESFSDELRPQRPGQLRDSHDWAASRRVREVLVAAGLLEARPMPFVSGAEQGYVRVANPLAENEGCLRRELLETLAKRAEHNLAHMEGDVRLFEIGAAFSPAAGALPVEELRVAALVMGRRAPAHFTDATSGEAQQKLLVDEWDVKALAELAAAALYAGEHLALVPAEGDVLWNVTVGGQPRGTVRRVQLDAPVWAAPAFGFEMAIMQLQSADVARPGANAHAAHAGESREIAARLSAGTGARYRPLPVHPATEFDLALLVPDDVQAARVEQVIAGAAGDLLERLELFDVFAGAGIDAGHRSLAWRLRLRSPERTLGAKEIEGRRRRIIAALESELHVRHRTA